VTRPATVREAPTDRDGFELVATPAEVREMDRRTIADWGLPGRLLMELAGAQAARLIRERVGGLPGKAVVLCGTGNNGGDGYVVARHLLTAGWSVQVVATGVPREGTDAAINHALWVRLGGELRVAERGATARMRHFLNHGNVIVDALFGTGLSRPLEGPALDLVMLANTARHGLKVALDVPSGLDAARGEVLGAAFEADLTITFGLLKTGLFLGAGPAHAGEIVNVDLGFPRPVIDTVGASCRRATEPALAARVPPRPADGHKGTFGHVGVLGGAPGMDGAAILTGRAALRAGAGLCTWIRPTAVATPRAPDASFESPPSPATHDAAARPTHDLPIERPAELMVTALEGPLPSRPTVLVVGPGLGALGPSDDALVDLVLSDPRPAVHDADLLNALAARPGRPLRFSLVGAPRVITPHPLEAARLLGLTAAEVQSDRLAAATRLAESGAVVVLKGARTIVAAPDRPPTLIDIADPTLAVGGSGDVLAGVIAGLMAQGTSAWDAALVGAWAHAAAGRDRGAEVGQRGVFASEIADAIPAALAALTGAWR
jgi:NAD(P)H-hydrate epimerase